MKKLSVLIDLEELETILFCIYETCNYPKFLIELPYINKKLVENEVISLYSRLNDIRKDSQNISDVFLMNRGRNE